MASQITPLAPSTTALTGSDQAVVTGDGVFYGGCFASASDTKTVDIYDNTSAAGTKIAAITLTAGAVENLNIPNGIAFTTGLYVDVGGSGTLTGSVHTLT
mgnify:CR=1 FL=1|tara:strand:+ start:68 stop:367 length:300 start_codon:yes stop_codon:yes gene_type:complete